MHCLQKGVGIRSYSGNFFPTLPTVGALNTAYVGVGQPKVAILVWTSYGEAVGSRVKVKMAIEFFSYMPIQRPGSYCRN